MAVQLEDARLLVCFHSQSPPVQFRQTMQLRSHTRHPCRSRTHIAVPSHNGRSMVETGGAAWGLEEGSWGCRLGGLGAAIKWT